jgi:hypothetical protein
MYIEFYATFSKARTTPTYINTCIWTYDTKSAYERVVGTALKFPNTNLLCSELVSMLIPTDVVDDDSMLLRRPKPRIEALVVIIRGGVVTGIALVVREEEVGIVVSGKGGVVTGSAAFIEEA